MCSRIQGSSRSASETWMARTESSMIGLIKCKSSVWRSRQKTRVAREKNAGISMDFTAGRM